MVTSQAAILSFDDLYRIMAVLMLAMVPAFLWLRRAQPASQTQTQTGIMTAHAE
jgi:hypothetical protein